MPKRKLAEGGGTGAAPPAPVGSIKNFFITVQAPTSIAEDTRPPNLFPEGDRQHIGYVPYNGRTRPYRISHAVRGGELMAGCTHCTRNYLDMVQFAPPENNINSRRRPQFFDAYQAYKIAIEERDLDAARAARATLEELRNAYCPSCQETHSGLPPAQQECKDEYERMRKTACAANDGCANQACAERGPQAWCVLEGDHLHTAREEDKELRKTKGLGDYTYWSGHGGVEAMRAEEAKIKQWVCRFCHRLEKTGAAANRYTDPEDMPDGKRSGTAEEVKLYKRKHTAKIVFPKQQHVEKRKRAIGCCKRCKRSDVEGKEWCFDFDHRDEATKLIGRDTLAGEAGGVAGLVHNCSNAAVLYLIKPILDAEMDKCDLLCSNCHHRKTNKYPMREC